MQIVLDNMDLMQYNAKHTNTKQYLNMKDIKMYITLNIGLEVSKHYLPEGVAEMKLAYEYVKERLERTIGKPAKIELAQSNTEQTIVVQYTNVERTLCRLFYLAAELKQDCIAYAVYDDNDTVIGGALVGEYAHEWNYGIFNKQYFIEGL